jgi:hypothetical protein
VKFLLSWPILRYNIKFATTVFFHIFHSHPNIRRHIICMLLQSRPIRVVARSKAWTVFARSNTGILGSNSTWGIVCVRLFCVCAVLCTDDGLATGWSPVQGVLPTV